MRISDFLSKEAISVDLQATDKKGIIAELVDLLISAKKIDERDRAKLIHSLLERESLGSTGVGHGIGIPHGKLEGVRELMAAFGISQRGIDFQSLDGDPVYLFFLLVAPQDSAGPHLKALARISRLLKDKFFRNHLRKASSPEEVLETIHKEDLARV